MKKILISFFILPFVICAQSYNPQKDYKEIEKDNIRIVYPSELKDNASQIMDYIDYQNKHNRKSTGEDNEDFVIILHNDTTVSNGFVTAGPFRSEFFGTAPISSYELGATPWFNTLSVHEYRHALQMMHGREGMFNKVMYFLGGEYGVTLGNVLAIPKWYWEGDAVSMETALSRGGRGRLNYFLKEYRARLLDGEEIFSYEKAKNGSYKDYVPDHYLLGYLICAYGRERYGYDFWKNIFGNSVNYKHFPPMSKNLKERTGMNSEEFYTEAMTWWKKKWEKEMVSFDSYNRISPEQNLPTDYLGAYKYKDGYISLRKKFDECSAFVYIDKNGIEEKIVDKTISISDFYHCKRGLITWASFSSHKTNPMIDYSNIILYNIEKREIKKITDKSKYFAPSIAEKIDMLAVSEIKGSNSSRILLLDFDGNIIKEIYAGDYICNNPVWAEEDKVIITTARNSKGHMALLSITIEDGTIKELIPFGNYIMENIYVEGEKIYFSATFDSVDDIYAYNMATEEIKRLSMTKYGAYKPTFIEGTLFFSEYEKNGYSLRKTSDGKEYPFQMKTLDELVSYQLNFFKKEGGDISTKVESNSYKEKDYIPMKNLLNFHSWMYSYGEDELYLNLISTNETTDFNLNFEYIHDFRKDKNLLGFGGEFIRYSTDFALFYHKDNRNLKDDNEIEIKTSIPINLTEGYYYRYITPSLSYLYNHDNYIKLSSLKGSLIFSNFRKKAYTNPISRTSQEIEINYTKSLDKDANKLSFDSYFTFEALGNNDYIKLGLCYEVEDNNNDYTYSDTFNLPRGYDDFARDNIIKTSFDYSLPLFYPDNGIDGFYIKRMRSSLFYDYAKYEINNSDDSISSVGIEIFFDTSILSLIDLSLELRYSYKIDEKEDRIEFIIPLQYL
jgi:hypothetical protein